jgi:glycosyltransferase involved in cell wall biosynthesis
MANTEGGVATYMRTFLKFRRNRELFIKLVLVSNGDERLRVVENDFEADEVVNFVYNKYENVYYILRRMSTCIESPDDIILANEKMELTMVNLFKMPNKVLNIIHGDSSYYYDNIGRYSGVVDGFIAASDFIYKKASGILERLKGNSQIIKIFAPVMQMESAKVVRNEICKIIYVGRVDKNKGSQHILGICRELDKLGICYKLSIAGTGYLTGEIKNEMGKLKGEIILYGFLPNKEILDLLKKNEIMLFPSYSEAVGLSVVEAMKSGLVPVTSDLPSGLPEIVIEGVTGFRVPVGNEEQFAAKIALLHTNPVRFESMRNAAIKLSNELFDPGIQTENIESFINNISKVLRDKSFKKDNYGFRLDTRFLPNFITVLIRRALERVSSLLIAF